MNLKPGDKFQLKGGQDWWVVDQLSPHYVICFTDDGTHKSAFSLRSINPDTIIRKSDEPKYVEKVMYTPIVFDKMNRIDFDSGYLYNNKEDCVNSKLYSKIIGYTEVKVWIKE